MLLPLWELRISLTSFISDDFLINDAATKSTPILHPNIKSHLSLSVTEGRLMLTLGTFTPL